MEQEMFNKLPYETQTKLENLAMKCMLLELTVREHERDNFAILTVRPMYKNPYGDEYRHYTDSYSVVRACGKHLFASMQFTGSTNSSHSYGFDVSYDDFYYSVDLERAKQMYNTLKWLDKRISEEAGEMFKYGSPNSFAEYITAVSIAIGATGGIVRDQHNERIEHPTVDGFLDHVTSIEQTLQEKYAQYESEKEVA